MKTKAETNKGNPVANGEQEEGSIDKIRDILFGVQMRESEKKVSKIEESFSKEMDDMKMEMRRKLESLEQYIKNEIKALSERITSEQNSRMDSVKELSTELKNLTHSVDKKVTQINEHAAKSESALRDQILAQSKNLTDDSQQRHADLLSKLASESGEIRSDKADRSLIAQLFTEMAMRLTDESPEE